MKGVVSLGAWQPHPFPGQASGLGSLLSLEVLPRDGRGRGAGLLTHCSGLPEMVFGEGQSTNWSPRQDTGHIPAVGPGRAGGSHLLPQLSSLVSGAWHCSRHWGCSRQPE